MNTEPPWSTLSVQDVATRVGVPAEAISLTRASDVIDLHVESFIPARLYGYDLGTNHRLSFPFYGRLFGHLDVPRAIDGGLTGAMWSIATNITRPAGARWRAIQKNLPALRDALERTGRVRAVRTHAEYVAARAAGQHGALLSVQGGNAFDAAPNGVASLPDPSLLTRVTVVHLSSSRFGSTSSPAKVRDAGITPKGREFVQQLDAHRIFVDLAHASPATFWGAVEAHDRSLPLIATHTGISAVKESWRNLDTAQLRAIADSGGVIGVIFHNAFLRPPGRPNDGELVIDHLQAIVDAVGEDHAALGSDYDGFILPPPDLRDGGPAFYRLVARMLARGWSAARIQKILGANFLRSFRALRP